MPSRKNAWVFVLVSSGLLLAISLPYLWAAQAGGGEYVFGGFLLNPLDGNTYLAKMRQGWQGSWTFTLPYTANPGEGVYLFLYYLFLGHLARLTGASTILTFHAARLIGTVGLLLALWRFFGATMPTSGTRLLAFCLAVFGSGLGWLGVLLGVFTSDLWVAEAYPFLSAYANAHFPLGLALMVWLVTPGQAGENSNPVNHEYWKWLRNGIWAYVAALVLGLVMPFGVVVACVVLAGLAVWEIVEKWSEANSSIHDFRVKTVGMPESPWTVRRLLAVLLGGGLPILYAVWVTSTHPVLRGWNAQNLTLSPSLWDFVLSFSPALLFALPGAWAIWRGRESNGRVLLVWGVLGILLMYLPIGLQRRLLSGMMIPLAGLAVMGVAHLSGGNHRRKLVLVGLLFMLAIPSNLIVLLSGVNGIQTRAALLYVSRDELAGFAWLEEHSQENAVVLTGPETGLFIPAYTGRRVIYGHPYETVDAASRKSAVERFFKKPEDKRESNIVQEVDLIFFGPREKALATPGTFDSKPELFHQGEVVIYGK